MPICAGFGPAGTGSALCGLAAAAGAGEKAGPAAEAAGVCANDKPIVAETTMAARPRGTIEILDGIVLTCI